MLDRMHVLHVEQLRKEPHHHFAVFDHARHARGRAQVVLENDPAALLVADQIDTGDVGVDAVVQVQAQHGDLEGVVGEHLLGGNDTGLEDLLIMVDVVREPVQRGRALLQTLHQQVPLALLDDAWNRVERNQPLGALLVAVDGERDPDPVKQKVRFSVTRSTGVLASHSASARSCPRTSPGAACISS